MVSNSLHWIVADPVRNLVTVASFVLALLAFVRTRPRVHVGLRAYIALSNDPRFAGQSVIEVSVANNGPSPLYLQDVRLQDRRGRDFVSVPHALRDGYRLPCKVESNGDLGVWLLGRDDLRASVHNYAGPVEYRAVVRSGRRKYRSRERLSVHPEEPRRTSSQPVSVIGRARDLVRSNFEPRVQFDMMMRREDLDLERNTVRLHVVNFGGGLARRASLELWQDDGAGGGSRVESEESRALPAVFRHKRCDVEVPLQEDSGRMWWIRYRDVRTMGTSALTRTDAAGLLTQFDDIGRGQ